MKQIRAVEELTLAFLDSWNDSNPTQRLSLELIKLIDYHFHLAFVAGCDGISEYIVKDLKKFNAIKNRNVVSINQTIELIERYEP